MPGRSCGPTLRTSTPQCSRCPSSFHPTCRSTRVEAIAPAIDPLSPKNLDLDISTGQQILDWIGVELPGRLVTQVSRFDAWKDPLGVIAAYRLVREEIPDLQLALVGSMALDDPEGWEVYGQVSEHAEQRSADPPLHQPYGCRQRRGQRLPATLGGDRAEVDSRGLRACRLRVAVEGHARRRRSRRRHTHADARGGRRTAGRLGRGVRCWRCSSCCATASWQISSASSGRDHVREHFLLPRLLMEELRLLPTLDPAGDPPRPVPLRAEFARGLPDPASTVEVEASVDPD